jgi:short subunit dehydrogenase-like uncharacterized protein
LLHFAYGRDFVYDEMMMTGSGPAGENRAKALARREAVQTALIGFAPTRALIRRVFLPKPGQGPSKAARDAGFYDILFIGETSDGRSLRVSVKGDKDPGYGSTSKMIAESGICLARDVSHRPAASQGRSHLHAGEWLVPTLKFSRRIFPPRL